MAGTFSYRQALKEAVSGAFGSAMCLPTAQGGPGASNSQSIAEAAFAIGRRRIAVPISDANTAATAMSETPFFWAESWLTGTSSGAGAINVVAVEFLPQLTVSVAGTNYYTLTLAKRTSGGTASNICQMTSNTGGTATTAFTAVAMPVASGVTLPVTLVANTDVLTIALTKTGSGAAISSATGYCFVVITIDEL
jgi:hypothetical protein